MERHLQSVVFDKPITAEPLKADADKLLRLVQYTQNLGTWRYEVTKGRAFWSRRVSEIHGRSHVTEGMALDAAIRAFHPADAKTVAWLIMNAIQNKVGFTFVLRVIRPDGEIRLVQSAADIDLDASGNVVTIFGLLKDVTDRYSEMDVAESRGWLVRSIISNSPAPLVVLDKHLRYLELSPSWIEYYHLPPARALIGKSHYEVMPDLPQEFRKHNERALAGEAVHSRFSYWHTEGNKSTERGAAIFPWRTANDEVGGIIIMLTLPDQPHAQDDTLSEIASLFSQLNVKPLSNGTGPSRVLAGTKW